MGCAEIIIEVTREKAEALSDALLESGALSVSIEDADSGTSAEIPLFGEPGMIIHETGWQRSRVVALTDENAAFDSVVKDAIALCGLAPGSVPYSHRAVADQDWIRLTQSQFEPIHIGTNIWVVPSWHHAPDAEALILELDPGLAFGTGSHPTTCLCMEWLEQNVQPATSLLDYGCGSGILAILAKKLGAHPVVGVDIDPQAITSAISNSQRNRCEVQYLLPDQLANAESKTGFDIVVANILSGPLVEMVASLTSHIAKNGWLVLSGILEDQASKVIAAYKPFIELSVFDKRDGWVVLSGQLHLSHSSSADS